MERLAAIYNRKGTLFISAVHRTTAGFWIDDEQVAVLKEPIFEELGRIVLMALARSQEGVPTPPPTARLDKPLLKAAGVGSWTTFMKSSKHVSVSINENVLKITPHRNLGGREGFEPQPDLGLHSQPSDSALGQAIIEALGRAV